jgi:hypothetical protein
MTYDQFINSLSQTAPPQGTSALLQAQKPMTDFMPICIVWKAIPGMQVTGTEEQGTDVFKGSLKEEWDFLVNSLL